MSGPLLQLREFGLTDLSVHWSDHALPGRETTSRFRVGYKVGRLQGAPLDYRLTMTVKDTRESAKGQPLVNLEATIVGFFTFPEDTPEVERNRIIRTSGLPILFSTLRGVLASVTGVFPPDFHYVLPTVNMLEVIRSVEGQPKSQAKAIRPLPEGSAGRAHVLPVKRSLAGRRTKRQAPKQPAGKP